MTDPLRRDAQGLDTPALRVALRVTGLTKTFADTRALVGVSLEARHGEILALLGGNGSGKSTAIKVLAGVHAADPGGQVEINGAVRPLDDWDAHRAREAGIRFVHQDMGVFPELSVAENLALGHGYPTAVGRIRWRELRRDARRALDRYGLDVPETALLGTLRPADRAMVAVARALQDTEEGSGDVLVLDEPTASLPAAEVEVLMSALRRYADAGRAIVVVTHRLDEVRAWADRVVVLRDGRNVGERRVAEVSDDDLIELITGRPVDALYPEEHAGSGTEVVLRVRGVSAGPLRGVDLDVHDREIVGVAGLLGSGRSELLRGLFGTYPIEGTVELAGRPHRPRDARRAMAAGVAYVPEDRAADGAFGDLSVRHNLSAAVVRRYWSRGRLQHAQERVDARRLVRDFGVKTASVDVPLATLSGGNQQKVVLARWLRRDPSLLLLDEPTQGVDVGARADIYRFIRDAADAGTAVVVVSSDFEELAGLCDRVLVLRDGVIAAEVSGQQLTAHRLTELVQRTRPVEALA